MQTKLNSQDITVYSAKESEWISRVSAYVSSKAYQVEFYRTLPTQGTGVNLQCFRLYASPEHTANLSADSH